MATCPFCQKEIDRSVLSEEGLCPLCDFKYTVAETVVLYMEELTESLLNDTSVLQRKATPSQVRIVNALWFYLFDELEPDYVISSFTKTVHESEYQAAYPDTSFTKDYFSDYWKAIESYFPKFHQDFIQSQPDSAYPLLGYAESLMSILSPVSYSDSSVKAVWKYIMKFMSEISKLLNSSGFTTDMTRDFEDEAPAHKTAEREIKNNDQSARYAPKAPMQISEKNMILVLFELLTQRTQHLIDIIDEHIPKDEKLRLIVIFQTVFAYHIHILLPIFEKKYGHKVALDLYHKLLNYSIERFKIAPEEQAVFINYIVSCSKEFKDVMVDPKSKEGFGLMYSLAKLVIRQCGLEHHSSNMEFITSISALISFDFQSTGYIGTDYDMNVSEENTPIQKKADTFQKPPDSMKNTSVQKRTDPTPPGSIISGILTVLVIALLISSCFFLNYLFYSNTEEQSASSNFTTTSSHDLSSDDVWISRTGEKYHLSPDCSNMENPIHISKHEARLEGYQPCRKCFPVPQMSKTRAFLWFFPLKDIFQLKKAPVF